jgi:large subunit ribosomal protein L9
MKVILAQNFKPLGSVGEVVRVAGGYARNFLLPKGIVYLANDNNMRDLNHRKMLIDHTLQKAKAENLKIAEKINSGSVTISKKVTENDKLYGSVTAAEIEDALVKEGIQIDKKMIEIGEPIKSLGVYSVPVKIASDVEAKLKVWVVEE